MGQVYKYAALGYPGAISHSADAVVISRVNKSTGPIAFGTPVFLNADGTGVIPIAATMTAADTSRFVGIAVRSGAKTPDTYQDPTGKHAESTAAYLENEVMDILVRGSVTVNCSGSGPKPGGAVHFNKEYGIASATASDNTMTIPDINFLTGRDSNGRVEILLRKRNLQ